MKELKRLENLDEMFGKTVRNAMNVDTDDRLSDMCLLIVFTDNSFICFQGDRFEEESDVNVVMDKIDFKDLCELGIIGTDEYQENIAKKARLRTEKERKEYEDRKNRDLLELHRIKDKYGL